MFRGWRSRNPGRYYVERFRAKYPEKAAAHDAVQKALRQGVLTKPAACQRCPVPPTEPLHAHHDDYGQPLRVEWLCRACHRTADLKGRAA